MPEAISDCHHTDYLLYAKDQILGHWRDLPPEHRVAMVLVMVAEVIDGGEYGAWLCRAISLCRSEQPTTDIKEKCTKLYH